MKDRNQKQRRHIRAARQWLGEAETSLAENHRVRGELKVMLAKAELARVEGTPGHRFVKRWSMRLMPALVALVIAGGGYALWQSRTAVYTAAPAPVRAQVDAVDAVEDAAEPQEAVTTATSAPEAEPAAVAPPQQMSEAEAPAKVTAAASPQAAPQETAPAAAEPHAVVQSAPKVPDDGMQKLMQTAGKTLRR
ncbi:preprotein translocase subunit SecG [Mitsuokella multacida]|uniref:preprotein translocase subunit SecG n=1 Tax=Mitsuokella multacida TaxID=52226 RepID=UPI00242E6D6D|nr:preprotein translocase subunit SecG [Mitsuokella multacida]